MVSSNRPLPAALEAAPAVAEPRAPGRPSSLTPAVRRQLLEALRAGHTRSAAARLAGVSPSTLSTWLSRAGFPWERATPWDQLQADVDQAEAEAEARAVACLLRPGSSHVRFAAWYLENRYPEAWGKPSRRGPRPKPEPETLGPLVMGEALSKLSDEQLGQVARGELSAEQLAALLPPLPGF